MMVYNAKIWNKRNGLKGEPYKRLVIDPILIKFSSPINNKVIVDAGCGNGYLGIKLSKLGASRIILIDNHKENLAYAQINNKQANVNFKSYFSNLTSKLPIKNDSADIVVSNMVLTEIKELEKVLNNFSNVLKENGKLVFSVIHPLYDYHHSLLKESNKVTGLNGYFDQTEGSFILGTESHPKDIIKVKHIHRTIEDYVSTLLKCGFKIENIAEPKINNKLLKVAPRFKENYNYPISLIISAIKRT